MMLLTNIAEDMSLSLNNDAHIETVARLERCGITKENPPVGSSHGRVFRYNTKIHRKNRWKTY